MRNAHKTWTRVIRTMAVARAEVGFLFRDRLTLSLIGIVPAVQLILFGYAVELNPTNIPIAIARVAPAIDTRLQQLVSNTGYFKIVAQDLSPGEATSRVRLRQALIAVEPSPTTAGTIGRTTQGIALHIVADASDPAAIRPALLALQTQVWKELSAAAPLSMQASLDIEWLHNTSGNTAWAITPGLIGVIVMITTLMLSALCLVRERESGNWQNLMVVPLEAHEVILGKLLPMLLLAILQTVIVLLLAHLLFAVPLRGSIQALIGAAALFAMAHLLFGLMLSALVANQLQAIQAAVFFYLPCMLLSGFMFPFEGMPRWAQIIGEGLPLTHFVRVARGVLLRGEGMMLVAKEMAPVALFVVVASILALQVYRHRWVIANRS